MYDSPYQCIREILQNSVDATLIRIWLEYGGEGKFRHPGDDEFMDCKRRFPICVSIFKNKKDEEFQYWKIDIEDKGIGISDEDLKYLTNTGSSSEHRTKNNIIDEMPSWMKPSGIFGIGFQSIFMIADAVTIETKSFFDEQFQIIELNGPKSKKSGDILIKKKKTDHKVKPGAKLSLIFKTAIMPKTFSVSMDSQNTNTGKL